MPNKTSPATRTTCCQNAHGSQPGTYFANIWRTSDRAQLGHGEGASRKLAIAAAQANEAARTSAGLNEPSVYWAAQA